MTHLSHRTALVLTIIGCIALAACNSSNNPSPSPTATPSPSNISGDYTGTMTDAVAGTGSVTGTLAQSGANAGGSMTLKGSNATISAQFTVSINASNAVSGAIVVDYPSGTTCTYSTSGTYTNNGSTSAVLSGSYTAVTNCTGDTGTYTLNQQCTDTVAIAGERRRLTFPIKC
jgi:hypothetical protein